MTEEGVRTSSDLIRWLKMLGLPAWAKAVFAVIMLLMLVAILDLLFIGKWVRDKDSVEAAMSVFTPILPLLLITILMMFAEGGSLKLRQLTGHVLEVEVPQAIKENLASTPNSPLSGARLDQTPRGFITDYALYLPGDPTKPILRFRLELNVRKVNVVVWIHQAVPDHDARKCLERDTRLHSCLVGAEQEGYVLNPVAQTDPTGRFAGLVFIKQLPEDFLLNPADRLYFVQDFSFFVRGLAEALPTHG